LESQDTGLVSNDQVAREADSVNVDLSEVNSLSEEVSSSRVARAAASDARERKNKESRRRRKKKASKKTAKRRNKSSMKSNKNKKDRKARRKNKNKNKKNKKEKKTKANSSKRKKKNKKGKKSKLVREDTDGNTITIVCPECPKTLICAKSNNRNGEKLTRKEKKMWKKTRKIEKKIEKINNKYLKQMARNGDAEEEEDKLCTPCCPPTPGPDPTTTPSSSDPTTTPSTTLPPDDCTPCVKQTATVMDVWRFQVGNFEKQKRRVENQNNIATNKASEEKTKPFTDLADHLAGLSCAMNMAEIDDTKMKLMECPAQITAACNLTMINQTFVDECTIKTGEFVAEVTKCKDGARQGKSDECPCFKSLYDNLSDVKQCKIAETSTIATEFKACKTAFSDCKKLEDSVGPLVIKGMCGTATTTGAPRLRRKWLFDKLRV